MMYKGISRGLGSLQRRTNIPVNSLWLRAGVSVRNFVVQPKEPLHPELLPFMHGRGNRERRDSVTNEILWERMQHAKRISRLPVNQAVVRTLEAEGLGDKRRKHQVYAHVSDRAPVSNKKTNSGAG